MARTHAWLLHPGPPPVGGWLRRLFTWLRLRLGGTPQAIQGPVELGGLDTLAEALEGQLGSRYRCLPVIPRPGPLSDEALRELQPGDRLVILTASALTPPELARQLREVDRMLRGRPTQSTLLRDWNQRDFAHEAHAWAHRMHRISCLSTTPQNPTPSPAHLESPEFHQSLSDAIRQAEREAGWPVPEDWIRAAVARAWTAIDQGQSIEEATTLPDSPHPSLPWIDEVLAPSTDETS